MIGSRSGEPGRPGRRRGPPPGARHRADPAHAGEASAAGPTTSTRRSGGRPIGAGYGDGRARRRAAPAAAGRDDVTRRPAGDELPSFTEDELAGLRSTRPACRSARAGCCRSRTSPAPSSRATSSPPSGSAASGSGTGSTSTNPLLIGVGRHLRARLPRPASWPSRTSPALSTRGRDLGRWSWAGSPGGSPTGTTTASS